MSGINEEERALYRARSNTLCGPRLLLALSLATVTPAAVAQEITGQVIDAETGGPIAGARVHEQARPALDVVLTDAQGQFALPVSAGATDVPVAAALPYSVDAPVNYETAVDLADEGQDIVISLRPIPEEENLDYQPIVGAPPSGCGSCHSEQYAQWQESNHARAAVNVRLRDLYSGDGTGDGTGPEADGYVFTELHDPEDTGFCATCHSPNENPDDPGGVKYNEVSSAAGLEGVTCTSCHQLHVINDDIESIHLLGSSEFRFPLSLRGGNEVTHEHVWGPLDDVGFGQMRAAYAPFFKTSKMCAQCHEYENPVTGAPGQDTYSEWLGSPAAAAGVQCQTCHMPEADGPGPIAAIGAAPQRPAEQRHDHSFPGVYSGVLGDPIDLEIEIEPTGATVDVVTRVHNRVTGHDWPTGVDVRNAMLVVEVSLNGEALVQIAGDRVPEWANDAEPGVQPGDFGGLAGRGYAHVLEGRINGEGPVVSPVNFIDADALVSHSTIPPGQTDLGRFSFDLPPIALPGDELVVRTRVVYRRVWREIAVTKGWVEQDFDEPWERVVEDQTMTRTLTEGDLDRIFFDRFGL
ncbi:MAG: multiheme c-type cytochrome [Wenzhouxiangella sp.]|nr:multiheme c-type cytochrome [Wenzhouxiangella sp.]